MVSWGEIRWIVSNGQRVKKGSLLGYTGQVGPVYGGVVAVQGYGRFVNLIPPLK